MGKYLIPIKPGISEKELLKQLGKAAEQELAELMTWWATHMVDEQREGFYGKIDGEGNLDPHADKGIILNTRLLWTFSAAAHFNPHPKVEELAHRAYEYLIQQFWDRENQGFFWMLDAEGRKKIGKKQIYAQAFAIYALSEYFILTEKDEVLEWAIKTFELIESHSLDLKKGGYWEAFDEKWGPLEDLRLGENDQNEAKTMNTHLHIMEAYSNLSLASNNKVHRQALRRLLSLFLGRFISPTTYTQTLFFDDNWEPKSTAISYGHDIECSWLLWEAADILDREELIPFVLEMVKAVRNEGRDKDGAIWNEKHAKGHIDREKIWWPQAEAVVGFFNAYQLSGDPGFLGDCCASWNFIQERLKDHEQGEWYWSILPSGQINRYKNKAGPWKAPYHNARACIEILKRIPMQALRTV